MPRRNGATLIEVLVAIFIMGIGMMALLTLFPLGALRMAKAIQDDRAAQAGVSATSIATVTNIRSDSGGLGAIMDDPSVYLGVGAMGAADSEKKSYPVFVDPIGYQGAVPPFNRRVAGLTLLPRYQPSFIATAAANQVVPITLQWFSVPDDLVFDNVEKTKNVGNPKQLLPGIIERNVRYSWAYLVQRPRTAEVSVVDLSVIVFDSRPLGLTGNLTPAETAYQNFHAATKFSEVTFEPGRNVITVNYEYPPGGWSDPAPQVRAGNWVLDLSTVGGEIHAYFYRVTGITDSGTSMEIEVEQPLRGFTGNFASTAAPANQARLIVIEGIAEVFERGVGTLP